MLSFEFVCLHRYVNYITFVDGKHGRKCLPLPPEASVLQRWLGLKQRERQQAAVSLSLPLTKDQQDNNCFDLAIITCINKFFAMQVLCNPSLKNE